MPISTSIFTQGGTDAALIAFPVLPGPTAEVADQAAPGLGVEAILGHYQATAEAGEVIDVPVGERTVLLYGVGDRSARASRKAAAGLVRRARGRDALAVHLPKDPLDTAAFAEGAMLAAYHFKMGKPPNTLESVTLVGADPADVARGEAIAKGVALARDLNNTPSSVKSPEWLAEQAVTMATENGLASHVWTPGELAADGFGGILAVGMGSSRPPRLIRLSYEGTGERHVVLIGKGITFDSGGLSLKPTDNMKLQKTDMSGGGAVIGVMSALRALGVRAKVTGLIPCAENMPSGSAQRPSDVITQYGGRTVEVLNTDAEGRLVLADALAYAAARVEPDVVVDIATLTGAAKIALGTRTAALYSNDDDLAGRLHDAGEATGEPVWRMPLPDEYLPALKSHVADLANVEQGKEFNGGSIVAALFLREFVGGLPWAHLDIAGPGRSAKDDGEISKGGTGFGTRLLLRFLSEHASAASQ